MKNLMELKEKFSARWNNSLFKIIMELLTLLVEVQIVDKFMNIHLKTQNFSLKTERNECFNDIT